MTRKEFLKMCALLGIAIPLQSTISSCSDNSSNDNNNSESKEKVIIIGAGAAGMTAAYLLNQQGVDFQILEANSYYSGRFKRTTEFVDFPIPLGAEWLHVERGIFDEIINDSSITPSVKTTPYNPDEDYGLFNGQQVSVEDIGFTIDQKFIGSSWFDFFDTYVVPSIKDKISYNKIVTAIDYTSDSVTVKTADEEFTANKVIVAVPLKILQNSVITFTPELPASKQEAIDQLKVWDGCKAFFEFSEKFYPTFIGYDIQPARDGQKLFYDAAYGQNSDKNVLGLFAVGTGTLPYVNQTDSELKDYILNELDEIFDGKASETYVKHIFQNWNNEPFANGAYITDQEDWRLVRRLGSSIDDKVYFAGDAYTDGEDWASVHAVARSAISTVGEIVG